MTAPPLARPLPNPASYAGYPISKLASIKELDNSVLLSKTARKVLGKLEGHAPGETNLQSKQDLICHIAKVKFATSTHSMADVIPFQRIYFSLPIKTFHNTKRKYILHTIKKTISVTLTVYVYVSKAFGE